jgi:hypothetical protein
MGSGEARQIYFKICSTIDSTERGSIGPVAEAPRYDPISFAFYNAMHDGVGLRTTAAYYWEDAIRS